MIESWLLTGQATLLGLDCSGLDATGSTRNEIAPRFTSLVKFTASLVVATIKLHGACKFGFTVRVTMI
jgi:hypothetical protein